MSDQLKIGLIGAGVFAGYHADKLTANPWVSFTGVMDRNQAAAANLAERHHVKAMTLEALLEISDAVVIAAAASSHGELAIQALMAGCHCLIEKPLATTSMEVAKISRAADSRDLIVQVGHQERLILRALGLDEVMERPLRIDAVRNSKYSARGTDTSVTMDLMTHDIDLCTVLLRGCPDKVDGETGCVRSDYPDMSRARLTYDGCVAYLEASRVAEQSERRMKITYASGVVEIDFNAKTVRNSTPFELNENFAEDERAQDSLGAATDIFVRAVLFGKRVLVPAYDGAKAVATAERIDGLVKDPA